MALHPKTNNPSEARMTAARNPGTGAQSAPGSSGPGPAPASAPPAPTEAAANPDKSGADGAKAWGSDVDNPGDIEVVAATETDPRGPVGENLNTPAQVAATEGGQQVNPEVKGGPAGLRVKFKGEERVYDEATARTMIQQFLSQQGSAQAMAPIAALAEQVRLRTGITDPAKIAAIMAQALNAKNGAQPPATSQAPATTQPPAAGARTAASAAAAASGGPTPMTAEQIEAQLDEMERVNGLRLPAEMRNSLGTVLQHAHTLRHVAGVLPGLEAEVSHIRSTAQAQAQQAVAASVDTRADAVAKELGLTDDDFQPFEAWVGEQAKLFPGFNTTLVSSPDAMESALRTFAALNKSKATEDSRQALQDTINNAAARAGGDGMAAPRGGANGPGRAAPAKDFNQEMMDTI